MNRLLIALLVVICLSSRVSADDFCIYNKVYIGKDVAESTTIFRGGRVYDLLTQKAEITIFDPSNNRFVIIDPERKLKTEVTTDQIEGFIQRVRSGVANTEPGLATFLIDPVFEESYDPIESRLTLKSDWLTYEVKSQTPKFASMAQQYAPYIQWQTKLNSVLRIGSLPPFPRMKLNEALARQGRLPVEVAVTRYSAPPLRRPATLRSEHRIQAALLPTEQAKIDEADRHLATFPTVSMIEYQRSELPVAETAKAPK
ncbi:MAG: hypothetical protein JNM18_15165 [Planctomycetaceae bacterium]|nr:hypothetical protein [Planctomycetaceae bacterium]